MGAKHDGLLIALSVLVLIFSVVTFFGVGTFVALTDENGGFEAILDKYETRLSPPPWAYYIWFLVGIWQVAWVLYVLTTICRYTETGPMYRQPPVISKLFMCGYLAALLLNCVAFLLLVNDFFLPFIIFLLLLWFTLALTMVFLHLRLDEYWVLLGLKYRRDLYMLVVGAQNGVAAYATWVTKILLMNLCPLAAAQIPAVSQSGAVIAAIVVLLLFMTLYFLLDVTVFDRYTRFTFVPYPLVFWALVSVIYHQWHPSHWVINPLILAAAFVVLIMLLIKVAVISGRKYKNPKRFSDVNHNGESRGMTSLEEVRPSEFTSPSKDALLVRAKPPRTTSPREDTALVRGASSASSIPSYRVKSPLEVESTDGETRCQEASPYGETPHEKPTLFRETPCEKPLPCVNNASHTGSPPETPKKEEPSQIYTSNVTIMKDVYQLTESPEVKLNYQYECTFFVQDTD